MTSGSASWMALSVVPNSLTSSGKKSVARISAPTEGAYASAQSAEI